MLLIAETNLLGTLSDPESEEKTSELKESIEAARRAISEFHANVLPVRLVAPNAVMQPIHEFMTLLESNLDDIARGAQPNVTVSDSDIPDRIQAAMRTDLLGGG
ncbi:hypothetical protein GCM10023320_31020 [Pseudonocardia adelaidensis]|uniref:Uncharacterized protein n=2 Tax=Pseudonocardia adelaidensis TaxID=648754 RepID=A0ABP9NKL3_9PSEU